MVLIYLKNSFVAILCSWRLTVEGATLDGRFPIPNQNNMILEWQRPNNGTKNMEDQQLE